jgi:3-oxoacyl-[acyl-carrier-protein] synthase-1
VREFVTACGVVCPLGRDGAEIAVALREARSHFTPRNDLIAGRTVQVGAVREALPEAPPAAAAWDCRNNRLMLAALRQIEPEIAAATELYGPDRVAVILGTSTAGIAEGDRALTAYRRDGVWPRDFNYSHQEAGNLAMFAAAALGLTGPAYSIATACSSSAKVFASARRLMRAGLADAAVVGGADTLCRMTLNGFAALGALSPTVCNPFSRNRDGITIGEGASAFLLSNEAGPVELLGVGESSDAHHITAPDPTGRGARAAMTQALIDARLRPEDIAYINLHGTGTPLNDAMEATAVTSLFPASTPASSSKGMTGHMLGATGGVEAALLWLALSGKSSVLPPHLWDGQHDPALPRIALVPPGVVVPGGQAAMLSNSFGFGGSNASLILARA